MNHGFHTVAVQHLFHGGGRHEIGFAAISFKKTKAFFCGFDHPFSARGGFTDLLLELGKQGVVLKHVFNQLARVGCHYTDSHWLRQSLPLGKWRRRRQVNDLLTVG